MNYTKNYHLPQWDETDRIMRTDFNQMCADMEAGLAKTARDAAAASEKAAGDAAQDTREAESRAFDRICRLAYNHYCFAQTITPFPRQTGVFHLDTSLSGAGLSGMAKCADYYQMNNAPSVTADELLAQTTQTPLLLDGSKRQNLTATFTAPSNGRLGTVELDLYYTGLDSSKTNCYLAITYRDLTTGQTLQEFEPTVVMSSEAGHAYPRFSEPIQLYQGHQYQITVWLRQNPAGKINAQIMKFYYASGATGGTATASRTFQNPEENLGFLAVASYQFTKNCAAPKLLAGGEEVPAWWSRTVEDGKGNTIREIVFRRNAPVKNNETVQLQLFCGAGETLTLYSWGVTLL